MHEILYFKQEAFNKAFKIPLKKYARGKEKGK